jgi:hypothetical protein
MTDDAATAKSSTTYQALQRGGEPAGTSARALVTAPINAATAIPPAAAEPV